MGNRDSIPTVSQGVNASQWVGDSQSEVATFSPISQLGPGIATGGGDSTNQTLDLQKIQDDMKRLMDYLRQRRLPERRLPYRFSEEGVAVNLTEANNSNTDAAAVKADRNGTWNWGKFFSKTRTSYFCGHPP